MGLSYIKPKEHVFDFPDLTKLPWLDSVVKETLRLHATAPNGTFRYSTSSPTPDHDHACSHSHTDPYLTLTALHGNTDCVYALLSIAAQVSTQVQLLWAVPSPPWRCWLIRNYLITNSAECSLVDDRCKRPHLPPFRGVSNYCCIR